MAQGPLAKKFKGSVNKRIINKSKSNSNNSSSHGLGPKKGGKFIQFIKKKLRVLIFIYLFNSKINRTKKTIINKTKKNA